MQLRSFYHLSTFVCKKYQALHACTTSMFAFMSVGPWERGYETMLYKRYNLNCPHTGSQPNSSLASTYNTKCPAPSVTEHQITQPTAEESPMEGTQHGNANVHGKCSYAVGENLYIHTCNRNKPSKSSNIGLSCFNDNFWIFLCQYSIQTIAR